jgi:hypothetical protein
VLAEFERQRKELESSGVKNPDPELDVDLLLASKPTQTFKAKLRFSKVHQEAIPDRTDNNEAEPMILAYARVYGPDIPEGAQIPADWLVTGVEVRSRVRCGLHPMGYSLFYGVWEFFYEKVVWFF